MDKEKKTIERQIGELITPSKCTFKLHSTTLDVIGVDWISILNCNSGDFGTWNVQYDGRAKLAIKDNLEGNCQAEQYDINGYAQIEGDTVVDIDKTISVYKVGSPY